MTFVGPTPETLELFGDKTAARTLAAKCRCRSCPAPAAVDARRPRPSSGLLATAGGDAEGAGRRRRARHAAGPQRGGDRRRLRRCASEAKAAFGDGALYAEQLLSGARHVEVQILGDGTGAVVPLCDRECSLQRRARRSSRSRPVPAWRASVAPGAGRRRREHGEAGQAIAASAPSSSWSTTATTSSSSRPIRACRSSTRSPRR